jgi:hypothetical protein
VFISIKNKNCIIWIGSGVGAAVIVTVILVITFYTGTHQTEPLPEIVMVYHGERTMGSLNYYYWHGSRPEPNTEFPFRSRLVNITQGDSIDFIAVNASRQPDYYGITVHDETVPDTRQPLPEDYRLERNSLQINYNKDNDYGITVAATWVRVDLSGQHYDSVQYDYLIRVIK